MQENNCDPITLLEEHSRNTVESIEVGFGSGRRFVCDFHLEGIEKGQEVPGGYQLGNVINIDHHAAVPRMRRFVSSANLAIEYVGAAGIVNESDFIIINHTDCDSILSSAILRGILPSEAMFGEAAIAADHTGKENQIADLLQGMSELRSVEASLRNLRFLLQGNGLEENALLLLRKRQEERTDVRQYIAQGHTEKIGQVYLLITKTKIDAGLVPAFLPDARIIVVATPYVDQGKWEIAVRMGLARPEELSLDTLDINSFDPAYGGRWNAGSNRRGGGTIIEPWDYARALDQVLLKGSDS